VSPSRIHALGPLGTFSEAAARRVCRTLADDPEGRLIELLPTALEVLERTEADPASWGVVPIENSDAGTVWPVQDRVGSGELAIIGELALPVRFKLLSKVAPEAVRTLYVHPVAQPQCSRFLEGRLAAATVELTASNTASARLAQEAAEADGVAVVVPSSFEAMPELVVAENLQNSEENTTRFLILQHFLGDTRELVRPGRQKLSLLMHPEKDRPGLLYEMLGVLRRHNLNLSRIESRPSRKRPWTYVFYLDLSDGAEAPAAVEELFSQDWGARVLGSYDSLP
jgi:chorismate mutase/prephenate dehydratase